MILTPLAIKAESQKQAREFETETIKASLLFIHRIRFRTKQEMDGMTIIKKDEG